MADYFYVWLRRSIGSRYPSVAGTLLTPKTEELIASPYRFDGSKQRAAKHFEDGFVEVFRGAREKLVPGYPITVVYAFKQSETDQSGVVSTGWETMLSGLISAGFMITATWPVHTERPTRTLAMLTNALASSIFLAGRPRPDSAEATSRRGFISSLKSELPDALRHLQQGSVAPVDLAQAAIGPGMAVFSRYARVVEADGTNMTVRTALALINQVLDETLLEQEGDFDSDTRFCVKWFTQFGWNKDLSGTADTLSRATNTSTGGLERGGVFRAVAGQAWLIAPEELSEDWDPLSDDRTSVWEVALHLARTLANRGVSAAGALMASAGQRVDLDSVKELAYLLFSVCERKGWTSTALLFNALGTSWSELESASRSVVSRVPAQAAFTFDAGN
ncbi:hypothetical protein [Pseudarthrobacter oxydans]|uniref:hypothetical protein n=1 Tax=Pseudarthrobacter oxydans TaxID=1671 RepID=UPI003828CD1B